MKYILGCHAAIAVTFAIHVLQVFLSLKYPQKIIEIPALILFTNYWLVEPVEENGFNIIFIQN